MAVNSIGSSTIDMNGFDGTTIQMKMTDWRGVNLMYPIHYRHPDTTVFLCGNRGNTLNDAFVTGDAKIVTCPDCLKFKDHLGFLDAISQCPTDPTPRLIYSDFLDEHGDAARAKQQRLKVVLWDVLAHKTDQFYDLPRLRYAAICEQYGDKDRAEFIRVQVESAEQRRGKYKASPENDLRQNELEDKQDDLFDGGSPTAESNSEKWGRETVAGCKMMKTFWGLHAYSRGFIEKIACPGDWWLTDGTILCQNSPITEVQLSTHLRWEGFDRSSNIREYRFVGDRAQRIYNTAQGVPVKEAVLGLFDYLWPGVDFKFPESIVVERPAEETAFEEHVRRSDPSISPGQLVRALGRWRNRQARNRRR